MPEENDLEELENVSDDLAGDDLVGDDGGADNGDGGHEEDVDRGDELTPAEDGDASNSHDEDLSEEALQDLVGDGSGDGDDTDQEQVEQKNNIPFSRFQEVNLRMQDAERKLAELKDTDGENGDGSDAGEGEDDDSFNFADREQAYTEALLDGDSQEASKIRAEINEALRDEMRKEANELATKAVISDRQERQRETAITDLNSMANSITSNNNILDEKDPEYNSELADEVVEWSEFYINKGTYTPATALEAAAKRVLGDVFSTGSAGSRNSSGGKDKRTQAAVERGLRATESQPPKPGGLGRGERAASGDGGVSVKDMSEDDFGKLSEKEKSKLRGD